MGSGTRQRKTVILAQEEVHKISDNYIHAVTTGIGIMIYNKCYVYTYRVSQLYFISHNRQYSYKINKTALTRYGIAQL